jgi:predicted negative regulator of RcsB-dependent stress response
MSEATQSPTLEQSLNKTDLGHILYENRKTFLFILIFFFALAAGYSLWKQSQKTKTQEISVEVFNFQTKTWAATKEGKVSPAELVKVFGALAQDVQRSPLMVPLALEMGKFLFEKGALTEADLILSKLNASHPIFAFFVANQRAVILEKAGHIPQAIAVLSDLAKTKDVLMAPKVNVELGRLNLANGDKAKAKIHFDYVINNFPNDEEAKLAKLFLARLNQ